MKNSHTDITRECKSGFTLIELLVVIAIIAVLAAILLPALQTARKKSKDTVCRSQLKQLGIILALYANDYDDWLPPGLTVTGVTNWAWGTSVENGGYLKNTVTTGPPDDAPTDAKLLRCPTDRDFYRYWNNGRTYGMFYYSGEFGNNVSHRFSDQSKTASRWLIGDSHDSVVSEVYVVNFGSPVGIRHLGRANVMYWDLSVGSHTMQDATDEGFPTTYDYGT